jgi:hypothetical protein
VLALDASPRHVFPVPVVPPSSHLAFYTIQEDMSLNDLLDSLFAEIAAPNDDEELFERYLNLDGYDHAYNQKSDPEPSNPPTSIITPPLPPPHPAWAAPLAQGASHYSAPVTPCSNIFGSCGTIPVPRPTGLGTSGAYWNTQTGMCTPPCTIGHGCMPMVSPSPQ